MTVTRIVISKGYEVFITSSYFTWTLNGSYTLVCISSRHLVALLLFVLKCLLVIFPSKQDSQVGSEPTYKISKGPFFTSLLFYLVQYDQALGVIDRLDKRI